MKSPPSLGIWKAAARRCARCPSPAWTRAPARASRRPRGSSPRRPISSALSRLYSGNPLALALVAEPIRELFGGDVGAFLAAGDAFFTGVGKLLRAQFARSTPLEQAILRWLAVERELVPLSALLVDIGDVCATT